MTDQERIAELEAQLRRRDASIAELRMLVSDLQRQIAELRAHQAKDSHNSSKPPSSDGLKRRPTVSRPKSGRKPGGQPGHAGHTLERQATPDHVVTYRPASCEHCQHDLREGAGQEVERRQVQDVPPLRLEATDHVREAVRCPACQHTTRGTFPAGVRAAVQYGPHVRTLATSLHQVHLLPFARTCQTVEALCGLRLSERALERGEEEAAQAPRARQTASRQEPARCLDPACRVGHWLSRRWLAAVYEHPG
jgi:transposase